MKYILEYKLTDKENFPKDIAISLAKEGMSFKYQYIRDNFATIFWQIIPTSKLIQMSWKNYTGIVHLYFTDEVVRFLEAGCDINEVLIITYGIYIKELVSIYFKGEFPIQLERKLNSYFKDQLYFKPIEINNLQYTKISIDFI